MADESLISQFKTKLINILAKYRLKSEKITAEDFADDFVLPVTKGGTGASTEEGARGSLDTAYTFTTKISTTSDGWTLDNGMYKQTVACSGLISGDTPIVDVATTNTLADDNTFIEAWSHIKTVIANQGELVFYTDGEKPAVAFSVNVKVVR